MRNAGIRISKGQSLPEFLVALPVFFFLVLLIFQVALIYRAKTVLDYATLEAARVGSLHGASLSAIENGLAHGLTPLFATEAGAAGTAAAWLRAQVEASVHANIHIINPTQEAMMAFREPQYNGEFALPNDNLAFRNTIPDVDARVNVQDANLLKIQVNYSYPLIIPFVDRILAGQSGLISGGADPVLVPPVLGRHFRIPLQSQAVVRMQSPIFDDDRVDLPSLTELN